MLKLLNLLKNLGKKYETRRKFILNARMFLSFVKDLMSILNYFYDKPWFKYLKALYKIILLLLKILE